MPNQRMDFDLKIKTSADLQGLNKLKQSLSELKNFSLDDLINLKGLNSNNLASDKINAINKELLQVKNTATKVDEAFNKAFDTKLGRTNLQALNKELNKIGLNRIQQDFAKMGTVGNQAFIQLAHSATTANLKLKEGSTLLDKMGTTLANTVRWQISSAVLNKFVGSFQEAWGYAKSLDTSLNDIRIVTGKSADEMERFAEVANKTAKTLGAATTDYTKASLIYYQQGLDDLEAQARAEVTIKAANVTGQSTDEVSEQLTAVWNGYKVSAEETETYIDKLAAVAASTAADLEELSTGMSKVAAAANAMGVDIDQLNAQLATIVSVTRQAPESVGTALKTVYARMSTISAGGVDDEDGTSLTSYTEKMNKFGINVLDVNGHLRDMGNVIEEIGNKWGTFNREQQVSLAQAMAGTRQYNNLLALFENFDKYQEALGVSQNSLGTLQRQQDIYMESTEAHLQQLSTAAEGVFDSLIDNEGINKLIDSFTSLVGLIEKFIDSIGGGKSVLLGLGSILTNIFSKNIAQTFSPVIQNFLDLGKSEIIKNNQIDAVRLLGENLKLTTNNVNELISTKEKLVGYYDVMTNEEINAANAAMDQYAALLQEKQGLEDLSAEAHKIVESAASAGFFKGDVSEKSISKIDFSKENLGLNENSDYVDRLRAKIENLQESIQKASSELANLRKTNSQSATDTSVVDQAKNIEQQIEKLKKAGINIDEIAEKLKKFKDNFVIEDNGEWTVLTEDVKKANEELNDIVETAQNLGRTGAEAAEKLKTGINDVRPEIGSVNYKIEELKNNLNLSELSIRQNIQAFSQLVGSITGVVFGVNSLSSSFDAFKDGKIAQGVTGLVFGISSLSRGISGAIKGIIGLSTLIKSFNALTKTGIDLEIKKSFVQKLVNAGLVKENALKTQQITLTTVLNALEWQRVAVTLALVAAVGVLLAAYKNYTKTLEENAKRADEAAKKATEQREALEEEASAIEELVSSYQSLANQYDQHEISLDELREKIYALCLSYGETDLALKAMIADYDELNKLMNESAINANQKVIDATQEEKRATNKNLDAQLYKAFGNRMDSTQGKLDVINYIGWSVLGQTGLATNAWDRASRKKNEIDLEGFGSRNTEENKLEDALEKLANDKDLIKGDKLNYNKFLNLIKENRSEVEDILLSNTSKAATQLKDKLNEVSEYLDAYEEATEKYKEYTKENIVLANKENIDSFETFNSAVEEMVKEAFKQGIFEEDNREEAYQWATKALAGVSDAYNQYSQNATLALGFMSSHPEKSFEEITKEIDNLSESEKLALLYLKNYVKEIEDIKKFSALGDFLEKESYDTKIRVALQDALDGQPLTNDKIRDIFKGLDDKYIVEIETKLNGKSAGNQAYDLILESIRQQETLANDPTLRQKAIGEVSSELDKYKIENLAAESTWKGIDTGIPSEKVVGAETTLENIANLAKETSKEEILNLAEALSEVDGDVNKLSPTLQQLQENLESNKIATLEELKAIGDASLAYKKYTNVINDFITTLQDLEKGNIDYAKAAENMSALHENANKEIDNLQKAYKTYEDTIKEYNKNNALSIDSLQSLIALGPEYLQYLIAEDGQLKLNKESMQQATIAQLEQAKASYIQAQAFQVKDIWENASSAEDVQAWINTYSLTRAEYDLTDSIIEETVALIKSKAATKGWAIDANQAAIAAENWARTMRGLSAEFDKSINFTKTNFGKAMDSSLAKRNRKNLEEEFDRYWDIKNAIEACADALERVNDLQSHLHGKELIQSLENENELLAQQVGYYEQLAAAQQVEANELQTKLSARGVLFDDSGQITNYAAITKAAVNAYNAGGDEEAYNEFKKLLDRYDKLYYDEMKDTQENIRKLRDDMVENNLKAWETEVTIKLDLKEAEREWNDFLKEINEDFTLTYKDLGSEFATIMKDLDTYMTGEGSLATSINALREIENEIDKMMAGGTSDKFFSVSDAQEKLKEYMKTLENDTKAMRQLYEDAWDALLDGIDQAADKFDDIIERFDLINDELEYQGQLISLLYGEEAYELMNNLFKAQEFNSLTQIKSLQQQKDMWVQLMSEVEEGTEEWQKYYDNLNDAQKSLNNLVTNYIKLLQDDYLNAVDDILSKLETAITSASLDDIESNWERIADNSAKYFDAIQSGFKVQELANKIKDSINDTDDINAQQKLQSLYDEEISYLREKENLTQHDIDYAEAKYQITLKQIALEEAQANKNSMKMTRNAQGNWTYQYVANDEDVLSKQQDLSNAYSKLYEIAKKGYQENLQSLQSLNKTYLQKSKEYAKLALTDKDRATKLQAELDEWYFDQYQKLAEENERSMEELHEAQGLSFKNLTEQDMANADIENKYILAEYTATAQKIADAWNADDGASVKSQILNAHGEITEATDEYQQKVDELANVVGEDFNNIKGAIDKTTDSTRALEDATSDLVNEVVPQLAQYRDYVDQCADAWGKAKTAAINSLQTAQEYLRKTGDIARETAIAIANVGTGNYSGGNGGGSSPVAGEAENTRVNLYASTEFSGSHMGMIERSDIQYYKKDPRYSHAIFVQGSGFSGYISTTDARKLGLMFDTGGYTGAWGNEGRLAFLHEKELVLNQDDTQNLLSAVNTIRGLTTLSSSIEQGVANSIAAILAGVRSAGVNSTFIGGSTNSTDNVVYNIQAEFPNANDVNEIREAILSLPNLASQYVNR